jgi:hypothetical protein
MTVGDSEPDSKAQRLGYALRSLAAELVTERQRTAALERENAELKARLEALGGRAVRAIGEEPAEDR